MLGVKLICVGKMKEKHFVAAFEEYRKRLGAFCKFELVEITEQRLSDNPSEKEIEAALLKEALLPGRKHCRMKAKIARNDSNPLRRIKSCCIMDWLKG